MGVDIDFSKFSLDDLMAVAARVNVLKKEALEEDSKRLGALAQPLADVILVERELQSAPISGWHGVKVFGLPAEHDGVAYTASVTFTDTARTEAAKAEIKAKSGPAYDAHLAAVAAKKAATKKGATPEAATDDDTDEDGDTEPATPPVVTKPGARAGK